MARTIIEELSWMRQRADCAYANSDIETTAEILVELIELCMKLVESKIELKVIRFSEVKIQKEE